ncbi:MAG: hypothetical protein BYD32DRAFT_129847 [Podila humilis]|nr:MAG: hypothetical protein BYD32DRAFT_129847 [Podila humilis]
MCPTPASTFRGRRSPLRYSSVCFFLFVVSSTLSSNRMGRDEGVLDLDLIDSLSSPFLRLARLFLYIGQHRERGVQSFCRPVLAYPTNRR